MVSRFAKPQIGQTSSDSKMRVFTGDSEDQIDADYTAPDPESCSPGSFRGSGEHSSG